MFRARPFGTIRPPHASRPVQSASGSAPTPRNAKTTRPTPAPSRILSPPRRLPDARVAARLSPQFHLPTHLSTPSARSSAESPRLIPLSSFVRFRGPAGGAALVIVSRGEGSARHDGKRRFHGQCAAIVDYRTGNRHRRPLRLRRPRPAVADRPVHAPVLFPGRVLRQPRASPGAAAEARGSVAGRQSSRLG